MPLPISQTRFFQAPYEGPDQDPFYDEPPPSPKPVQTRLDKILPILVIAVLFLKASK